MINMKFILLLGITGTLLTSGCASFRVITDLKPEADANLQSPAGRFYIAGLKYATDFEDAVEGNLSADHPDAVYERKLLKFLRKECLSRYPLLFTKDSTDSMPLWIKVDEAFTAKKGLLVAWILGTVCICPIILPLPMEWERDIKVTVGRGTSPMELTYEIGQKNFRREELGWMCFNPLGLIAYPGESDLPKESCAFHSGRTPFDVPPQVAQQVATAIAKLVASKDPSFWTTQPRQIMPTIYSPTRTSDAPAVIPLPSDSVNPF